MTEHISGYTYGEPTISRSPVSMEELEKLEQTLGWTEKDARHLKSAAKVLSPQAEEMVDHWRSIIAEQLHLLESFLTSSGKPDDDYRAAVKKRFVQWVRDTCERDYDQAWLDYQNEIALRHTPEKKNLTDNGHTSAVVPLRYVIAFAEIVAQSARDFLSKGGVEPDKIDVMHAAWRKSVYLQIALWSRAYAREDWW
jgi:hypothetical protein